MIETDDLLHKLLFGGLPLARFEERYVDDVGEPEQEVCTEIRSVQLPKQGLSTLFVLKGGLTVVEDSNNCWHLYESRERVEHRQLMNAWACFIRGTWTLKTPTEEGVYPTRDLEGNRGVDRTLRRQNGRLVDVTRGFVESGKITRWGAYWWDQRYPPLPGAI